MRRGGNGTADDGRRKLFAVLETRRLNAHAATQRSQSIGRPKRQRAALRGPLERPQTKRHRRTFHFDVRVATVDERALAREVCRARAVRRTIREPRGREFQIAVRQKYAALLREFLYAVRHFAVERLRQRRFGQRGDALLGHPLEDTARQFDPILAAAHLVPRHVADEDERLAERLRLLDLRDDIFVGRPFVKIEEARTLHPRHEFRRRVVVRRVPAPLLRHHAVRARVAEFAAVDGLHAVRVHKRLPAAGLDPRLRRGQIEDREVRARRARLDAQDVQRGLNRDLVDEDHLLVREVERLIGLAVELAQLAPAVRRYRKDAEQRRLRRNPDLLGERQLLGDSRVIAVKHAARDTSREADVLRVREIDLRLEPHLPRGRIGGAEPRRLRVHGRMRRHVVRLVQPLRDVDGVRSGVIHDLEPVVRQRLEAGALLVRKASADHGKRTPHVFGLERLRDRAPVGGRVVVVEPERDGRRRRRGVYAVSRQHNCGPR